jgi:hypothetical protein
MFFISLPNYCNLLKRIGDITPNYFYVTYIGGF